MIEGFSPSGILVKVVIFCYLGPRFLSHRVVFGENRAAEAREDIPEVSEPLLGSGKHFGGPLSAWQSHDPRQLQLS